MTFFFLLSLLGLSFGKLLESDTGRPSGWHVVGSPNPSQEIELIIAVKQQNLKELERIILERSNPSNERYGEWLTQKQVNDLVAPKEISLAVVRSWLTEHRLLDVRPVTPNSDYLKVVTTIEQAEKLIGGKYVIYQHLRGKRTVRLVQNGYEVPDKVAQHIDFISPTVQFPPLNLRILTPLTTPRERLGAVTPKFVRSLYNLGDTQGKNKNNTQAVASFQGQYYNKSDLTTFWQDNDLPTCEITDVPPEPTGDGIEAELDVEYITTTGAAIALQVWYTKTPVTDPDIFIDFATDVTSSSDPALVYSISYGTDERERSYDYMVRLNNEFGKNVVRGVTFLAASGDQGAAGREGCRVTSPFNPTFPACLPYMTAVGATTGGTAGQKPTGEVTATFSGGGFSNYFPQQTWQASAVQNYLSKASSELPESDKWNATGRGFPDVAAQGVDCEYIVRGRRVGGSGTSCSCPIMAGVISLLNDARLNAGKSSIGYLNPLLYQTYSSDPSSYNDVTSGRNQGCGGAEGFPAFAGWDAATGLGSIDFSEFVKNV